jgi:ABC-type sugar transport system ATPase subunit
VLILDEPTSSLDADEVGELFRVIRDIRDAGVAVLFVSHFLDQVYAIADRSRSCATASWSASTRSPSSRGWRW